MNSKPQASDLEEFNESNRRYWDEVVPAHVTSDFYRVDDFRDGKCALHDVDVAQVGDVSGKRLIHLQCHFGLETLSWARRGATVTGIDYSPSAIQTARALSEETEIPATFIESDVYRTRDFVRGPFDIVYTGVGALCWLPDVRAWAGVVASLLEPGGLFYIREAHPMLMSLDDKQADGRLVVERAYFETPAPNVDEDGVDYADPEAPLSGGAVYQWNHGLGETITALIEAGLDIEFVGEHTEAPWQPLPGMVEDPPGTWKLEQNEERLPLMYSIRATQG